jgi:2-dehydropantoate 2-reductase
VGQVPAARTNPIGIVGDGRVATHFLHYLALLEIPTRSWSRRVSTDAPPDALSDCSTVLLLVRDAAIVPFIEAWPALREKRLVHFSGSLGTPLAHAAHPLMTFGSELYDLATYRGIPFVLDAGGPPLDELLPGLPNPWFTLARAERPYYHALCVMSGTFSTLLWLKLFREFENRLGIPASAAHPYLLQTTKNLLSNPDGAFTGPVSRGDEATIAANLKALEGDPFHAVYLAFVRAYERRS